MTHTLHRRGDNDSLSEDYVMLIMPARGVNFDGSEEKMRQIWEVISHYEGELPNFGNASNGNSHRTTMEVLKKATSWIAHAVFKDRETLKACLKELKERDFGISVVISGLYEDVERLCAEVGLSPTRWNIPLAFTGTQRDCLMRMSLKSPPCAGMPWCHPT